MKLWFIDALSHTCTIQPIVNGKSGQKNGKLCEIKSRNYLCTQYKLGELRASDEGKIQTCEFESTARYST